MFKNYLKIAWRNLSKNKTYSIINIAGLAIGLSCFLLIVLYVTDELNFDRYNTKAGRIYRINSDLSFGGSDMHLPVTSDMMGQLLKKDYPEVEEYTRIYASSGPKLVKKNNEFINEPRVAHVDSTFFSVFTLPTIKGDTKTALNEPNTVVLTRSAAMKYFGSTDILNKTIETNDNDKTLYKVTAVIEDIPENSHFHFDFMFSMKNVNYQWGQLTSHNFHTYLLLKKGTDYRAFEKQHIPKYITDYVLPEAKQYMHINSMEEFRKAGNTLEYTMMPLTKIHLYSDRSFELSPSGNIRYVYIFSAVALFILIIACINFMNLTTARSANRAREVGIRKVLGTERKELIVQFLFESVLMVVISILIALVIDYFVLPAFNEVSGKEMSLQSLFSPYILPLLIALPFVVGLIAGSYPAFFLSAFRPIEVLKGKLRLGSKSGGLRSVLVVFQFATSVILIISTIVVYRQLNFIQNKKLGFNKDQVLIVDGAYTLDKNLTAFKNDVLQMPGVLSGTVSSYLPVSASSRSDNTYSKEAIMDSKSGIDMQTWRIDYDYIKTMGMEMAGGRNFSKDFGSDSSAIIINETTAKFLDYKDPVGHQVYTFNDNNKLIAFNIIGVVKNFNFESLRKDIGPLCFKLAKSTYSISFKVNAANINKLIPQVQSKWKALAPSIPFSYRFLDDSFTQMYSNEQRVGKIALLFSILAILIACLGLFGLATFIAEQRTKEIGIRKVLGSSVSGVVMLLSKDFIKLVLIAFVIAAPAAWWFMHKWLEDFAYRITIGWWIFLLAGIVALLIALLTVCFQAIKAAVANPVKSLRTE
jgi:putative ABC transport system permease protein